MLCSIDNLQETFGDEWNTRLHEVHECVWMILIKKHWINFVCHLTKFIHTPFVSTVTYSLGAWLNVCAVVFRRRQIWKQTRSALHEVHYTKCILCHVLTRKRGEAIIKVLQCKECKNMKCTYVCAFKRCKRAHEVHCVNMHEMHVRVSRHSSTRMQMRAEQTNFDQEAVENQTHGVHYNTHTMHFVWVHFM